MEHWGRVVTLTSPILLPQWIAMMAQVPDISPGLTAYERGGTIGLLILALGLVTSAFMFGWVVPGKDRDAWKTLAESFPAALRDLTQELKENRLSAGVSRRRS